MTTTTKNTKTRTVSTAPSQRERAEELKATLATHTTALFEELRAGKSDRFKTYLAFASRFYQYSLGNQMLILAQMPTATRVASFKKWHDLGYRVAKGATSIRILAPRTFEREETKADGTVETRKGLYFVAVPVFDVSQLNAEDLAARPLPGFYVDLGDDEQTQALRDQLIALASAWKIRVEERSDLEGDAATGTQGYSSGGYIALRAGLPSRNAVRTLVHEIAHELLHQNEAGRTLPRGVKEWEAEATSYTVLAHFGIHNEFSSDYLQSWSATPDELSAVITTIHDTAAAILAALDGKAPVAEAEAPVAE